MTHFETDEFREVFTELLVWRRDVRRFRPDPLAEGVLDDMLHAASLAPSVGLSQPWRFVRVRSDCRRDDVRRNFERCNAAALAGYDGEDAAVYARLKLEGLSEAPEQLAVFCDRSTLQGRGLGRQTMPETLDYSVVTAIQGLWLMARTHGAGVGWVSILDPNELCRDLKIATDWKLIAYLCIGMPQEPSREPELERLGWEARRTGITMMEI